MTTSISVDQNATPLGWVPVAYGEIQISVPASWAIGFGCPSGLGDVYLGAISVRSCPAESPQLDVVDLNTDDSPPAGDASTGVVNTLHVYWLSPDGSTMVIPTLRAAVTATGPMAQEILQTVTYSPRAVALEGGPSPTRTVSWRRVIFGGLRVEVPRTWFISRQTDWPLGCRPTGISLDEQEVVLSAGVSVLPLACPDGSYLPLAVRAPLNGLIIDPGPFGPITDGSFQPCWHIHGLRVCPTVNNLASVLVAAVERPGWSRPIALEVGLADSGITARTIVDSLRVD